MKEGIRIIGGKFRGKKIPVLDAPDLRPTPARVRETLFNWLGHKVNQSRCLDAFAGSGLLGLEALSRGASKVTLIEHSLAAYRHLKKIGSAFEHHDIDIFHQDSLQFIAGSALKYDIIFLDPPFESTLLYQVMDLIASSDILAEDAVVYTESSEPIRPGSWWVELKNKKAGQVYYGLYRKNVDTK